MSETPSSNKSVPRRWLALVLLLGASHSAVFFLARGPLAAADAAAASVVAEQAAGKSRERTRPGITGVGGSSTEIGARFTAMLHELERSGLPAPVFYHLRKELFREWIHRDLRSAMDLMTGPLTAKRYGEMIDQLRDEVSEEIARQPRESWDWITARRYGTLTPKVANLWLNATLEDGQMDLVLELMPAAPGFAQDDFVSQICAKARAPELAKVRAFLGSPVGEAMEDREHSLNLYAAQMLKISGAGGIGPLLAAEEDPEIRRALAEQWTARELNHLPVADAVRGVLALPEELRSRALFELADCGRDDPAGTMELLETMDAQGTLTGLGEEELGDLTRIMLSEVADEESIPLVDSYAALQRLSNPELRRLAYAELGGNDDVYSRVPEMLDGLSQIPEVADRDALLAAAIREMSSIDEELPDLLAAVSDRELAAQLEREKEEERVQSDQ